MRSAKTVAANLGGRNAAKTKADREEIVAVVLKKLVEIRFALAHGADQFAENFTLLNLRSFPAQDG